MSRRQVRPSIEDVAVGLASLASLLSASMPLARALELFSTLAPASWRDALTEIQVGVRNGKTLTASIESSSLALPARFIGVIKAGEERGAVAPSVADAAALAAQQSKLRQGLVSALAYPTLLLLAGLGTLALMIGVVLPRFAALLRDADVSLPRSTTVLLSLGDIAARAVVPTLIGLGVAIAIADSVLSRPAKRMKLHHALLSVPAIGLWRLRTGSAQVCSTLQGLLSAGLPIVRALDITAETLSDRAIGQRARQARESIVRGAAPAIAFRDARLLSDTALGLVAAGESSGRLVEMLRHAADLDQSAATRQLQTLVRFLEPSLIILLGGLIAAMAASLLQAMYAVRP